MNYQKHLTAGSLALVVVSSLFSCQDTEPLSTEAPNYAYHINVGAETAYDKSAAAGKEKRPLALVETAGKLLSTFNANDRLVGYNLNNGDVSTRSAYDQLTASAEGQYSKFTGTLNSTAPIQMTDKICFFYPGTALTTNKSVTPVVKGTVQGTYNRANTIKTFVELDVRNQDGTLATIGKKFDYQWKVASPNSVSGSNVKVDVGALERKMAIWGLRFTDNNNRPIATIDSISLSGLKSCEVFNLSNGEFVADDQLEETHTITVRKGAENLTSTGGKYTYVALLPQVYNNVTIVVFSGTKKYKRTYNTLNIEANKVYRTDVLNMELVTPKPYVDVQGVKWATGNVVLCYDNATRVEYKGLAPTQWWITDYATSQQNASYTQQNDFVDLFKYGCVYDGRILTSSAVYITSSSILDINKKGYAGQAGNEVPMNKATTGDIAWKYTYEQREQYSLPTKTEMTTLFSKANAIPAFCYTNKRGKVYGAYFYTNRAGTRINGFPVGARKLDKYTDVTALVQANEGLFLPYTGVRSSTNGNVNNRSIIGAATIGRYTTSDGASGAVFGMEFGTDRYKTASFPRIEPAAIRPVWRATVPSLPAANPSAFAPFRDIK